MYTRPYTISDIYVSGVTDTALSIPIQGRTFIIENAGAQPLYISANKTATAADGYTINAGATLSIPIACTGSLSVISNATGTTVNIMYLE